jgi:hypothetical protein
VTGRLWYLMAILVAIGTFAGMAIGGSGLGRALVDGVVTGAIVAGLAAIITPLAARRI